MKHAAKRGLHSSNRSGALEANAAGPGGASSELDRSTARWRCGTRVANRPVPSFRATIALLGINPYVAVPASHLKALLSAAGRSAGPIPVRVELGGATFQQHLVKYQGAWRLYLNAPMREAAGKEVGQRVSVQVEVDPSPRVEPMPGALGRALAENVTAAAAFTALPPSRRKEIQRYLNGAKTDATRERNVAKVIAHLAGETPPTLAVLGRRPRRG